MSDSVWAALIGGLTGVITGGIASIISPWANWGIEKRKEKLAYRRELIRKWRVMIAELYKISPMKLPEPKVFGDQIIQKPDWSSLQAHISPELFQEIKNHWAHYEFGDIHNGILPKIADENGR